MNLQQETGQFISHYNEGMDYTNALKEAQAFGFAETDPTLDVEGWDAK